MTELQGGRYQLVERWKLDTLGHVAAALDTRTGNRVRIFEFMNYRYPVNPQKNERLNAVARRADRFAEHAQRVMEIVDQAAEQSG